MSVVDVRDLAVALTRSGAPIVEDISFEINAGEVLALVGESGSGKSTIATAMLGYARRGAHIAKGSVTVAEHPLVPVPSTGLQDVRGRVIAYVPQDPAAALNPAMRLWNQIEECLIVHGLGKTEDERSERITKVVAEVGLPTSPGFLKRLPHQVSGGQQQRVCLAMAMVCEPAVLVLDEPTTGLDVTTQARVLATLTQIVDSRQIAALYVTHDLAVVRNLSQRVMVLYAGRVAEVGPTDAVFSAPSHPYSRRLLQAVPAVEERRPLTSLEGAPPSPGERPKGCSFAPRCSMEVERCRLEDPREVALGSGHVARCHRAEELEPMAVAAVSEERGAQDRSPVITVSDLVVSYAEQDVLDRVSLDLLDGECLAVVGESGSGKTTLARSIVGLSPIVGGEIRFRGEVLPRSTADYDPLVRRKLQYIFQSSYNALNPRQPIRAILATPIKLFDDGGGATAEQRSIEALERVSLSKKMMDAYPTELSGGERQRVAIARALLGEPDVLLCDEVTSALDVSVQASVVDLLGDLQRTEGLSLLFVTHNMALVRSIADRVVVMKHGQLVEQGSAAAVLDHPEHPYTQQLLADTPRLDLAPADSSLDPSSGVSP